MDSKRGLSDVVSTTLLLLITIAAAALLISFIMPFVQKGLGSSSECLPYRETFTIEPSFGYNCYDAANLHGFSVRANTPEKDAAMPTKFNVVLMNDGDSKRVDIINGSGASSAAGGIRLLDRTKTTLVVPNSGEVQTYVYNGGSTRYTKVELYPVAPSGRICARSAVVELQLCKGVTLTP